MRRKLTKHRYFYCCVLSGGASLLSFVNPMLAGVAINRAVAAIGYLSVAPLVLGMAVVNGTRILFRTVVSNLLGGRQRAPLIWLQHRIGKGLWWLEPVLHGWGYPGILLKKFGRWLSGRGLTERTFSLRSRRARRKRRLSFAIASSLTYILTDLCVTALSGGIYFYTRNYLLSLLPILLPVVSVIPWFTKKESRIKHLKKYCTRSTPVC